LVYFSLAENYLETVVSKKSDWQAEGLLTAYGKDWSPQPHAYATIKLQLCALCAPGLAPASPPAARILVKPNSKVIEKLLE
jgi:hypothetical protein